MNKNNYHRLLRMERNIKRCLGNKSVLRKKIHSLNWQLSTLYTTNKIHKKTNQ